MPDRYVQSANGYYHHWNETGNIIMCSVLATWYALRLHNLFLPFNWRGECPILSLIFTWVSIVLGITKNEPIIDSEMGDTNNIPHIVKCVYIHWVWVYFRLITCLEHLSHIDFVVHKTIPLCVLLCITRCKNISSNTKTNGATLNTTNWTNTWYTPEAMYNGFVKLFDNACRLTLLG